MSIEAINWAFKTIEGEDMHPSVAFTLVALAHCHNGQTGQCDPALGFLRSKTGLSERAVRNALRELERRRLVLTLHRKQDVCGTWNRSNAYTLRWVGTLGRGVGHTVPGGGAVSAPNRE